MVACLENLDNMQLEMIEKRGSIDSGVRNYSSRRIRGRG